MAIQSHWHRHQGPNISGYVEICLSPNSSVSWCHWGCFVRLMGAELGVVMSLNHPTT